MLKSLQQIFFVRSVVTFSPHFNSCPSESHFKHGTDCLQTESYVLVSGRTIGLILIVSWNCSFHLRSDCVLVDCGFTNAVDVKPHFSGNVANHHQIVT